MIQHAETLIDNLNSDLSHEYQAVIMYNTYSACVLGAHRNQLRTFFREEVPDELRHAEYLSDKIVSLGGTPTTRASEVPAAADAHAMLENVKKAEAETIDRYVERRNEAEALGDFALVNDLEEMISDETGHMEECGKILQGYHD